jgi:hypothetical protein
MDSRSVGLRWLIVVLALFALSSGVLVSQDFNYSNPATAATDHAEHHLPGVIAYSLGDTGKACSPNIPGYYVLLGAVRRYVTTDVVGLRFANLLLTLGLCLTLALALWNACPSRLAALLIAPFLFSSSVFSRGVWLGTDNPAWRGILIDNGFLPTMTPLVLLAVAQTGYTIAIMSRPR